MKTLIKILLVYLFRRLVKNHNSHGPANYSHLGVKIGEIVRSPDGGQKVKKETIVVDIRSLSQRRTQKRQTEY